MHAVLERQRDAHLARIVTQIHHLRQVDLSHKDARAKAFDESLEMR